jgi:hypothetical protein
MQNTYLFVAAVGSEWGVGSFAISMPAVRA